MMTPINPTPNQKIPEMKKERAIRILPKMERTIDSCFPMFFVLTIASTSSPYLKKAVFFCSCTILNLHGIYQQYFPVFTNSVKSVDMNTTY